MIKLGALCRKKDEKNTIIAPPLPAGNGNETKSFFQCLPLLRRLRKLQPPVEGWFELRWRTTLSNILFRTRHTGDA